MLTSVVLLALRPVVRIHHITKMMAKSTAVALLLLAAQASCFWRMGCRGTTAFGRIDPIVQPGDISAHVYAAHGGSSE